MDKPRRQKIEENIVKSCKISEQIDYHSEMLDELEPQIGQLRSGLYEDRPKLDSRVSG